MASTIACSGFSSSGDGPPPDAGAPDAISGQPDVGVTLSIDQRASPIHLVQGRKTEVALKLERRASSGDAVTVTLKAPPAGFSADPITIPAGGLQGTIAIATAADVTQGTTLDLEIEAAEPSATATAKGSFFVRGAPGSLDTTFGKGGFVENVFGARTGYVQDIAALDDGSVLAFGLSQPTNVTHELDIVHYSPLGAWDKAYGTDGFGTCEGGQDPLSMDVHRQGSPYAGYGWALGGTPPARLHRFSPGGRATQVATVAVPDLPGMTMGIQIAALPDGGTLTLAKHVDFKGLGVAKRDVAGQLDTMYGTSGVCKLSPAGTGAAQLSGGEMLVRADGSVLVVAGAGSDTVLKGCAAGGAIDTSIGSTVDHVVTIAPGLMSRAAWAPDGSIVVLKTIVVGGKDHAAWMHASARGVLDTSIGDFGVVDAAEGSPKAVVVQPDGKVVVAIGVLGSGGFTLTRHTRDGKPDTDFGIAGKTTSPLGLNAVEMSQVRVAKDGRILASGTNYDSAAGVIARYWP